ncbi:S8 family serine peptidase [Candidatus Acetothermia bacterium]|nr:S8 family serine peptidase [Candidatus Acetothermia bacterium]MCI2431429.1 S8 family serine peptidase [Candidatus Acetothermia bacterium]MCI2436704.1 S8 family serine peptidase [Candidatus Acetothermia bacterium]
MRSVLLVVGLVTLLFGISAAQGVPCPSTGPLATPCPQPTPRQPTDMQLIVEPVAKGLGPLRGGQALALIAYVASRVTLRTEVIFFVGGRLIDRELVNIVANCPPEGPLCRIGTQSVQVLWTAEPGPHQVTARLTTLGRTLSLNVLGPGLVEDLDFARAELLVRFKPEATAAQVQEIVQRLGTQVLQLFALTRIHHLRIIDGASVATKVAQFQREPLVEFAESNSYWYYQQRPNDPLFAYQWNLHNTGQRHPRADRFLIFGDTGQGTPGADIGALRAWAQITDSSSLVIALLDSGIFEHIDLKANLSLNGARDFARGDDSPDDLFGHGTFVASIIAAVGNNNEEIAGLAWRARLWPLKLSEELRFGWNVLLAALEHTIAQKRAGLAVRLINFSAGGSERSQSIQTALDLISQEGLLWVTAAGNYGRDLEREPFYPCSYPQEIILCVAASDHRDELAAWSSWGARTVDLAAPGEDILGLLIEKPDNFLRLPRTRALPDLSSGIAVASGTSYATAHVTGAAALLWALCPGKNAREIRQIILDSVEKRTGLAGRAASGGRLRWPERLAC